MEEKKKFLIIGLGNAGDQYAGTRHNIGFEVVHFLAQELDASFSLERYAYVARARLKGKNMVMIMPTTYMNLSGKAYRYWVENEKISPENTIVISDDLDLPLGTLRIRPKGGGGAHNGLNNIIDVIGHQNFPRLRFGIGHDFPQGYQVEYVLGRFSSEEMKKITPSIEKSIEIIKSFVTSGLQRTMNQYNAKG